MLIRSSIAALLLMIAADVPARQAHNTKPKIEVPIDPVAARREIEAANQDVIAAVRKSDLKAVADAFEPDAILLPPGADAVRGRDAIAKFFAGFLAHITIVETSSVTLDVTVSGQSAYETGLYTLTTRAGDAPAVADRGKYVVVWNRDGDDHWRVAREISNTSVPAADARQKDVRERGAAVMPFSLEQTLHVFEKTKDGGIQRVVARTASRDQVRLIRTHLASIAADFSARNFSDPARIHGADMPGLGELHSARPEDLAVTYSEIENGAQIVYAGKTSAIIEAIHRWFDAQLRDHGGDAAPSADTRLAALSWLAGSWRIVNGESRVEETWTQPSADSMLGMSRTLHGGETKAFEFMRIVQRTDGVFYVAQPRGRPPMEFPLQSWDGTTAVFINSGAADHLRRILYRRNDDGSMTARVEGADGGKDFAQDYAYRRVD